MPKKDYKTIEDFLDLKQQLMKRIEINENGCWLYTGYCNGYGEFRRLINGKPFHNAHRVSYLLHKGETPDGMFVLHKCSEDHKKDNPRCINPDHLYLGNHKDNMKDMATSGVNKGENNPMYGKPGTRLGVTLSSETKEKLRIANIGKKNPMYGKRGKDSPNYGQKRTEEFKKLMSKLMKGKMKGKNNPSAKLWEIHDKDFNKYIVEDLVEFCKLNKINYPSFVTNRKWRGWKIKEIKHV